MSGPKPLVSFVVPCYNYGRYLGECLSSILTQEGCKDFEIIAIDDASTDDTQEVLARFGDSRLRVILHERNQGHVVTVNEGLAEARGTFIARIDPDDRYRRGFLSAVLEKFQQHPDIGLVYGDAALIDDSGTVNAESTDRVHGGADFLGDEFVGLLERNFICAPTTMGRREAWQEVLPIPAGLAFNDWYLNIMMARKFRFYYIHRVLADYRVHSHNHHTKVSRDKSEEASIFKLLDRVYSEREENAELERAKRRAKSRVYATQYLTLADKYFGFYMNEDASRCYREAVRNRPVCLMNPGVMRRLTAAAIGREWYEAGKGLFRGGRHDRAL